jgi:hypothetical protein
VHRRLLAALRDAGRGQCGGAQPGQRLAASAHPDTHVHRVGRRV